MHSDQSSLASLIGSRICHDLISPIGAISNGLELVALAGPVPAGPEMSLIQQSCDNAAARIRFFRIAFGSAADHRPLPASEARSVLLEHYSGTRIVPQWDITSDVARSTVQMTYLAALCLETALPQGGHVSCAIHRDVIQVTAKAQSVHRDAKLWSFLGSATEVDAHVLKPNNVQFGLLSVLVRDAGVTVSQNFRPQFAVLELNLPDEIPVPFP